MPIVMSSIPATRMYFGADAKKPPEEGNGDEPVIPSTTDTPPVNEMPAQDQLDIQGLKANLKFDKEQVHGVLNKLKVFLAEMLEIENPTEASWVDVVIQIAKLLIDAAGQKKPQTGAA